MVIMQPSYWHSSVGLVLFVINFVSVSFVSGNCAIGDEFCIDSRRNLQLERFGAEKSRNIRFTNLRGENVRAERSEDRYKVQFERYDDRVDYDSSRLNSERRHHTVKRDIVDNINHLDRTASRESRDRRVAELDNRRTTEREIGLDSRRVHNRLNEQSRDQNLNLRNYQRREQRGGSDSDRNTFERDGREIFRQNRIRYTEKTNRVERVESNGGINKHQTQKRLENIRIAREDQSTRVDREERSRTERNTESESNLSIQNAGQIRFIRQQNGRDSVDRRAERANRSVQNRNTNGNERTSRNSLNWQQNRDSPISVNRIESVSRNINIDHNSRTENDRTDVTRLERTENDQRTERDVDIRRQEERTESRRVGKDERLQARGSSNQRIQSINRLDRQEQNTRSRIEKSEKLMLNDRRVVREVHSSRNLRLQEEQRHSFSLDRQLEKDAIRSQTYRSERRMIDDRKVENEERNYRKLRQQEERNRSFGLNRREETESTLSQSDRSEGLLLGDRRVEREPENSRNFRQNEERRYSDNGEQYRNEGRSVAGERRSVFQNSNEMRRNSDRLNKINRDERLNRQVELRENDRNNNERKAFVNRNLREETRTYNLRRTEASIRLQRENNLESNQFDVRNNRLQGRGENIGQRIRVARNDDNKIVNSDRMTADRRDESRDSTLQNRKVNNPIENDAPLQNLNRRVESIRHHQDKYTARFENNIRNEQYRNERENQLRIDTMRRQEISRFTEALYNFDLSAKDSTTPVSSNMLWQAFQTIMFAAVLLQLLKQKDDFEKSQNVLTNPFSWAANKIKTM